MLSYGLPRRHWTEAVCPMSAPEEVAVLVKVTWVERARRWVRQLPARRSPLPPVVGFPPLPWCFVALPHFEVDSCMPTTVEGDSATLVVADVALDVLGYTCRYPRGGRSRHRRRRPSVGSATVSYFARHFEVFVNDGRNPPERCYQSKCQTMAVAPALGRRSLRLW